MTFSHFPIKEFRHPEGADHQAAMASNADIFVQMDNAVLGPLVDGACGADRYAGGIIAVVTRNRDEVDGGTRVFIPLDPDHMPERRASTRKIVLIHAGHHTCHAAATS